MRCVLAFLIPVVSQAAIWPDAIGPYHRTATMPVSLTDRPVWDEYGLKESEGARYDNGASSFTATAFVLPDTTGALAAFDWHRPPQSTPSQPPPSGRLPVETADGLPPPPRHPPPRFPAYNPPPTAPPPLPPSPP